jgi:hypothetical protein
MSRHQTCPHIHVGSIAARAVEPHAFSSLTIPISGSFELEEPAVANHLEVLQEREVPSPLVSFHKCPFHALFTQH